MCTSTIDKECCHEFSIQDLCIHDAVSMTEAEADMEYTAALHARLNGEFCMRCKIPTVVNAQYDPRLGKFFGRTVLDMGRRKDHVDLIPRTGPWLALIE